MHTRTRYFIILFNVRGTGDSTEWRWDKQGTDNDTASYRDFPQLYRKNLRVYHFNNSRIVVV